MQLPPQPERRIIRIPPERLPREDQVKYPDGIQLEVIVEKCRVRLVELLPAQRSRPGSDRRGERGTRPP